MPFRTPTQPLCGPLTLAPSGNNGAVVLSFLEGVMPAGIGFSRASNATDYNLAGTLETMAQNAPRFDVFPTTLQPRGLLLEGLRTNLILNSADVTSALPNNTNTTVNANTNTAPDGTTTADQVTRAGGIIAYRQVASSGTLGQPEVFSQFVKQNGSGGLWGMRIQGSYPDRADAVFNLSTGVVAHNSATTWLNPAAGIEAIGNGWYRCWVSATSATSAKTTYVCGPTTLANNGWEGSGSTACGALVWGSQGEANAAFPSSYIPTTSSAATRAADSALMNDLTALGFNPTEGTMLAEFETRGQQSGGAVYTFGTVGNNGIELRRGVGIPSELIPLVTVAAVNQAGLTSTGVNNLVVYKHALAWKQNDFAAVLNGGTPMTDNVGTLPAVTTLRLGGGNSELFGWLRRLVYYPTRLPHAQLQTLTT